jgi:hypothetical protein
MLRALQGVERSNAKEFLRRYLLSSLRDPQLVAGLHPQYLCQLAAAVGYQTTRHWSVKPRAVEAEATSRAAEAVLSSATVSEVDEGRNDSDPAQQPQSSYFEDDSDDDYRVWLSKALNDVWCAVGGAVATVAPQLSFSDACELSLSLGRAKHYDPVALDALLARAQAGADTMHRIQQDLEQAGASGVEAQAAVMLSWACMYMGYC